MTVKPNDNRVTSNALVIQYHIHIGTYPYKELILALQSDVSKLIENQQSLAEQQQHLCKKIDKTHSLIKYLIQEGSHRSRARFERIREYTAYTLF